MQDNERTYYTPKEVGKILGCTPYSINIQAKRHKESLGFPVIMIGNRVKIPKLAFHNFMNGKIED